MIDASKKLQIARLFTFYTYQDLIEAANGYNDGTNDYDYINGFISPIIVSVDIGNGDPYFPLTYGALSSAGASVDDSMNLNISFEQAFTANKGMRNLSLEMGMILAQNLNDAEIDEAKPFDADINYGGVFYLLCKALESRYGKNLKSIADAYFNTAYKPLENYSMKEKETPKRTYTTDADENTNLTTSTDSDASGYGFNTTSEDGTPISKGNTTATTTGDKANNTTHSKMEEGGTRELERAGNIGVTTSQQMLQSELELRKYNFFDYVYSCLDRIMFASVYR